MISKLMVLILTGSCLSITSGVFSEPPPFTTLSLPPESSPPLPWSQAARDHLPLSEPNTDYTPCLAPNGTKASYTVVDGVKVFHLIAENVTWEVAKGLTINTWGYNGTVPGPLIEVGAGDRVRIYVTNKLPAPTTVHWHGVLLPCGMDGVFGFTQPSINPLETFIYEFIFPHSGTFMYHSHFDPMTQEGMGLIGMIVVHDRVEDIKKRPDRDFAIMLHEWSIKVGTSRPNPNEMTDFNILTMNGKVMPYTEPLVAEIGDKVWIRFGNLSATDHHPIHLHGYAFNIIGTDGGWARDYSVLLPETTVLVPVGSAKVIEFIADNPGDWLLHCHMTHHTMNQMGHEFPNMIGMDTKDFDSKMQALIPGYMTMGVDGMLDMTKMGMALPANSIPMLGFTGQFGQTTMGGMANVLKVRDHVDSSSDPGPYQFPQGTVSRRAENSEMERDGIAYEGKPQKNEIPQDKEGHGHH
jgi:manganese oxidase